MWLDISCISYTIQTIFLQFCEVIFFRKSYFSSSLTFQTQDMALHDVIERKKRDDLEVILYGLFLSHICNEELSFKY